MVSLYPTFGVRLNYEFQVGGQSGAALDNPLFGLLRALRAQGSITQTARQLGLSYRYVWGELRRWEAELGQPLVVWARGQPACLTEFGDRLLWAETRARVRLAPHIDALRAELGRAMREAFQGPEYTLTLFASHDLALPALRELARERQHLHILLQFCGSVDALQALADGRCQVAGFHVPDLPRGSTAFAAAMKACLEPGKHKLIGCVRRSQGLVVPHGNPRAIVGLKDLTRSSLRYVNRQRGSGTRLLMDHLLAEEGLDPGAIWGWDDEAEVSHLAVAAAVAAGAADVGPAVEAAAREFGLDFVPIVEENYYLVCLKNALDSAPVAALRDALASRRWVQAVAGLAGYAPAPQMGQVLSLTRALPWWHFSQPAEQRHRARIES